MVMERVLDAPPVLPAGSDGGFDPVALGRGESIRVFPVALMDRIDDPGVRNISAMPSAPTHPDQPECFPLGGEEAGQFPDEFVLLKNELSGICAVGVSSGF